MLDAVWSGATLKNPYLSFKYDGGKGESITLSWVDNKGDSDTVTGAVK